MAGARDAGTDAAADATFAVTTRRGKQFNSIVQEDRCALTGADAADALACAICHAHHRATQNTIAAAIVMGGRR